MDSNSMHGGEPLAHYIDHTLLKPENGLDSITKLCEEAKVYRFFSVCLLPSYVSAAKELLKDSSVQVCTVIGFPLGAHIAPVKAFESEQAVISGADELDMVIHLGALKDKNYKAVKADIQSVVQAANDKLVKVIIETCYLTDEEKVTACKISQEAGAHFVKTSTGFALLKDKPTGATVHDVALMRSSVGDSMGVKASGGIKNKEQALQMIKAGASRLGTSSGIQIVQGEA